MKAAGKKREIWCDGWNNKALDSFLEARNNESAEWDKKERWTRHINKYGTRMRRTVVKWQKPRLRSVSDDNYNVYLCW